MRTTSIGKLGIFTMAALALSGLGAGCGAGRDETDELKEKPGTLVQGLRSCLGGVNGDADYCGAPCAPCGAGQGDCDGNAECQPGLVCKAGAGPKFGLGLSVDVCVPAECANATWDANECGIDCGGTSACGACSIPKLTKSCGGSSGGFDYCRNPNHPCTEGEGDCHNNSALCAAGLSCKVAAGAQFGLASNVDVCVAASCANKIWDANECGIDCGGTSACGACVVPKATKGCGGSNGGYDYCRNPNQPCLAGEGDCHNDSRLCAAGLTCKVAAGAQFGLPSNVDVCVAAAPASCDAGNPDACGSSDGGAPDSSTPDADSAAEVGADSGDASGNLPNEPVLGCTALAPVARATFEVLGGLFPSDPLPIPELSYAMGISPEGSVVVGEALVGSDANGPVLHPFRWSEQDGLEDLAASDPNGLAAAGGTADAASCAGEFVAGAIVSSDFIVRPFRWRHASGLTILPFLKDPAAPAADYQYAHAFALSSDGIALGDTMISYYTLDGGAVSNWSFAVRWTLDDQVTALATLQGSPPRVTDCNITSARSISADGQAAVGMGYCQSAGYQALHWAAPHVVQPLFAAQDGMVRLSADGKVVIGADHAGGYFWTEQGGFEHIPCPSGTFCLPSATSSRGAVIVGIVDHGPEQPPTSFVWDAVHGTREFRPLLESAGIDLSDWPEVIVTSLSHDARSFTGYATHLDGHQEAFRAVLP